MAARKKAKTKAKGKKTPARKPATRRKPAKGKKKAAGKKPAARRAAPVRKPARRSAPAARPASPRPQPLTPAVLTAATAPLAGEERVGVVTHYYSHLSVAVVRLESGSLRVGDTIHIWGHTSDFRQRVESMQIEHESVPEMTAGEEFGLKVREHAREHDVVYKVTGS
jgi:hypothetical protein